MAANANVKKESVLKESRMQGITSPVKRETTTQSPALQFISLFELILPNVNFNSMVYEQVKDWRLGRVESFVLGAKPGWRKMRHPLLHSPV